MKSLLREIQEEISAFNNSYHMILFLFVPWYGCFLRAVKLSHNFFLPNSTLVSFPDFAPLVPPFTFVVRTVAERDPSFGIDGPIFSTGNVIFRITRFTFFRWFFLGLRTFCLKIDVFNLQEVSNTLLFCAKFRNIWRVQPVPYRGVSSSDVLLDPCS